MREDVLVDFATLLFDMSVPFLETVLRSEVPLEGVDPAILRDKNALGALGEKLFVDHVVPAMCRSCRYAISKLVLREGYIGPKYGYSVVQKLFGPLPYMFRQRVSHSHLCIYKLSDGKIDSLVEKPVVVIGRDTEELTIRIIVSLVIGVDIIITPPVEDPLTRFRDLEVLRSIVMEYKRGSSKLENIVQNLHERLIEDSKNGRLLAFAKELSKYVVDKINNALFFERLDLDKIHYDFMCMDVTSRRKQLSIAVTMSICGGVSDPLSHCRDITVYSNRSEIELYEISKCLAFEVKTSTRYSKIDSIRTFRELLHLDSEEQLRKYLEKLDDITTQHCVEYHLVLIHPIPLYRKALITVYRYVPRH